MAQVTLSGKLIGEFCAVIAPKIEAYVAAKKQAVFWLLMAETEKPWFRAVRPVYATIEEANEGVEFTWKCWEAKHHSVIQYAKYSEKMMKELPRNAAWDEHPLLLTAEETNFLRYWLFEHKENG